MYFFGALCAVVNVIFCDWIQIISSFSRGVLLFSIQWCDRIRVNAVFRTFKSLRGVQIIVKNIYRYIGYRVVEAVIERNKSYKMN